MNVGVSARDLLVGDDRVVHAAGPALAGQVQLDRRVRAFLGISVVAVRVARAAARERPHLAANAVEAGSGIALVLRSCEDGLFGEQCLGNAGCGERRERDENDETPLHEFLLGPGDFVCTAVRSYRFGAGFTRRAGRPRRAAFAWRARSTPRQASIQGRAPWPGSRTRGC